MARSVSFVLTVLLLVVSGSFVAPTPAQQSSAQSELLTEVRRLREAIESLASSNARVQIVFGRLQIQEQRTAAALQRAEAARLALVKNASGIAQMTEVLKSQEAASSPPLKPYEVEAARIESAAIRRQLEFMEAERTRLTIDEGDASSALNQEQNRWSDLNRQLEELERLLAKK